MKLHFYLFALIAVALAACGKVGVSPVDIATREVRDDLGQTVKVPAKIDRAISLAPNLTEMIFAVGAGDKLVGVTSYCNYPPEAKKLEKIGDTQTPNIEKIIALKPQVVFVSTASQLESFSKTLDEQGIAVYVTNPSNLDAVLKNLTQLGELFGTVDSASRKVRELSERLKEISGHVELDKHFRMEIGESSPRVFIQISNEPLFTIGKESFLTELIQQAGGESVTKDVPTAYPKLSKETAAALDPDVIILSDSEDNREPSGVLKGSKAVKNGRVYRINADIISRPGPRLVDALEEISAKLGEKK